MEKKKNGGPSSSLGALVFIMIILVMSWRVSGCPSDGSSSCRGCIADRMKYGCPSCTPILRCMARCLWAGNSQSRCTQRCNCDTKSMNKKLASCKKCMLKCKCSCASSS